MSIVLFIIFLLADLFMEAIFIFVYSGKETYKEGMILAVHVPPEAADDDEVKTLTSSYKKNFKRFHLWNLLAGMAICFLCFYEISVFFIVWMIWLLVYIFAGLGITYVAHYKMYQIKIAHGWILTGKTHIVHIDTAVSALTSKMPVSHWWQLPVVLGFAGSFLLPEVRSFWGAEPLQWILPSTILVTTLMFWGMHLWFAYRKNVVYSMDSSVNLSLNRMEKRTWSVLLLMTNYLSLFSWAYLVLKLQTTHWLYSIDYFIYIGLQMIPAIVLIVGIIYIMKKKQSVLSMDSEPITVDDDEYWKYGWYSNPNDSSFMVPDRLCSTNYSVNMAKPSAKIFMIVTTFLVTAALIFCIVLMAQFENVTVQCSIEGDQATFSAAMYHTDISLTDIESVEILDALPDDDYVRTNGGSTDQYLIGHFSGRETGKCMMYVYLDYTPVLKIKTADVTIYVNSKDKADVEKWYQELEK